MSRDGKNPDQGEREGTPSWSCGSPWGRRQRGRLGEEEEDERSSMACALRPDVDEDELGDDPGQLRLRFFLADDEGGAAFPFPP